MYIQANIIQIHGKDKLYIWGIIRKSDNFHLFKVGISTLEHGLMGSKTEPFNQTIITNVCKDGDAWLTVVSSVF